MATAKEMAQKVKSPTDRQYPVGKAQQTVLDALGIAATGHTHAQRIFDELNIEVSHKRVGRKSVPVVKVNKTSGGWNPGGDGWSVDLQQADDINLLSEWIEQ